MRVSNAAGVNVFVATAGRVVARGEGVHHALRVNWMPATLISRSVSSPRPVEGRQCSACSSASARGCRLRHDPSRSMRRQGKIARDARLLAMLPCRLIYPPSRPGRAERFGPIGCSLSRRYRWLEMISSARCDRQAIRNGDDNARTGLAAAPVKMSRSCRLEWHASATHVDAADVADRRADRLPERPCVDDCDRILCHPSATRRPARGCGSRLSPIAARRTVHVCRESLGGCWCGAGGVGNVQTPLRIALDDDFAIPQDHCGDLYAALQEWPPGDFDRQCGGFQDIGLLPSRRIVDGHVFKASAQAAQELEAHAPTSTLRCSAASSGR